MKSIRMADDSCLFCEMHGIIAGGHLFIGKVGENGWIRSKEGWLCIEHLAHCAVQICPDCVRKYNIVREG